MPPAFQSTKAEADDGAIAVVNTGNGDVRIEVNKLSKVTSLLSPLMINIIGSYNPFEGPAEEGVEYPGIDEKLEHNAVVVYDEDIRDQSGYMGLIEDFILAIDNEDPGAKDKLLWAINRAYKKVKSELFVGQSVKPKSESAKLALIRENADLILQRVCKIIVEADDCFSGAPSEIVEAAKELIVCYGFINCKILEPLK